MTRNIGEPILRYFKWTHTNEDMDIFNYASWLDNKRNPEVGFVLPCGNPSVINVQCF